MLSPLLLVYRVLPCCCYSCVLVLLLKQHAAVDAQLPPLPAVLGGLAASGEQHVQGQVLPLALRVVCDAEQCECGALQAHRPVGRRRVAMRPARPELINRHYGAGRGQRWRCHRARSRRCAAAGGGKAQPLSDNIQDVIPNSICPVMAYFCKKLGATAIRFRDQPCRGAGRSQVLAPALTVAWPSASVRVPLSSAIQCISLP